MGERLRRVLKTGCGECGKESGLLACNQCRTAHYCSKECQKKDWKGHKLECAAVRAAKAAGKGEARAPSADNADSFEALMVYTTSLLNSSMRDMADEAALNKIVLAQAPLREMSRKWNALDDDQQQRFQLLFTYVLVKHACWHADVHSNHDPRGTIASVERIRTRLQRHYSPDPVLESADGILDAIVGRCYKALGELERARVILERSVHLHDAVPAPVEISIPQWPGALRDLASISAAQQDLVALRKWREKAQRGSADAGAKRQILLESALLCQQAMETLRSKAQTIIRSSPALVAARSAQDVPPAVLAQMQSTEERVKAFASECDAAFSSLQRDTQRDSDLPGWSRVAACHTQYLASQNRTPDAKALAIKLLRVHACQCGPARCHDAGLAEAVAAGGGIDFDQLRGLPPQCETWDKDAWAAMLRECQ